MAKIFEASNVLNEGVQNACGNFVARAGVIGAGSRPRRRARGKGRASPRPAPREAGGEPLNPCARSARGKPGKTARGPTQEARTPFFQAYLWFRSPRVPARYGTLRNRDV